MAKKCHLIKMEVKYMGYVESLAGVNVDPKKVKAVQSFDRPRNLKQLRPTCILGLASYYRRFITSSCTIVHIDEQRCTICTTGLSSVSVHFEKVKYCRC